MKRPRSTIVFVDGIYPRGWIIRLACGHEATVRGKKSKKRPSCGDDHLCASCAALRTPRAAREVKRLTKMGLTRSDVEYLSARLMEPGPD